MSRHVEVARQSKWGLRIDGKVRHLYAFILGEPIPRRLAEMASMLASAATYHRDLNEAIRAGSRAQLNGNEVRNL